MEKKADDAFEKYETKSEKLWARTDLSLEEKHAEEEKLIRAVELANQKYHNGDPEIMTERRIIMRHKMLDVFYKQDYRYFPEFEQAYRIFGEKGAGDNSLRIPDTMLALEGYFVTRRQAYQHGLDELHPFQIRTEIPP